MRSRLLRLFVIVLAGFYIFWLLQREYRYKYLYAGALNAAVWRALNATTPEMLKKLPSLEDASLGIGGDAPRCTTPTDKLEFPASCDFFGQQFGGKSRNCRFWWLGRQCRIFYVPAAAYARPYVRKRIAYAFSQPCRVLYGGTARTAARPPLGSYADMLDSFNCRDRWTLLPVEIRLHIITRDGSIRVERHEKQ